MFVREKLLESAGRPQRTVGFGIDLEIPVFSENSDIVFVLLYQVWKACQLHPVLEDYACK